MYLVCKYNPKYNLRKEIASWLEPVQNGRCDIKSG